MEILFENENCVVVNKPAGISVHPDGRNEQPTVTDWVLEKYPKIKNVGEPFLVGDKEILRPGIVHRIDKETTGCLVIAKTQKMFEHLKAQFQNQEVKKEYHACVYGSVGKGEGIITDPIGRSTGDVRKWATGRFARGELRDAVTQYKVLARLGLPSERIIESTEKGTYSYIICQPKTGRTHQIRVHMVSIHHPVVLDPLYAKHKEEALGFKRLALHAYTIGFKDMNGEGISVTAPFPEDFQEARKLFAI
jgi:23S rRNA pseudouridine1911/1915/1917 synthase